MFYTLLLTFYFLTFVRQLGPVGSRWVPLGLTVCPAGSNRVQAGFNRVSAESNWVSAGYELGQAGSHACGPGYGFSSISPLTWSHFPTFTAHATMQITDSPGVKYTFSVYHCQKGSQAAPDSDTLEARSKRYKSFNTPTMPNSCSAVDLASQIIAMFRAQAILTPKAFDRGVTGASFVFGRTDPKVKKPGGLLNHQPGGSIYSSISWLKSS